MIPMIIASSSLFLAGMAFAYFVVFPVVFGFIVGTAPQGVAVMTDIGNYLDFVLTLFFAFGLAFQVPIAVVMTVRFGWLTVAQFKEARGYVVVGAFVIGAIFTPPDIISQFMLAMPIWLLFELGLIVASVTRQAPEQTILPPTA
jgi:sec-independent protein translocase protein TatC